ncbi:MAG: pyridoxamine 5'-phosphate oxidase [Planctomycetota bacterium]|jgi:pyridoxamine 5'-phosphate oxidase
MENLHDFRKSYTKFQLDESSVDHNPFIQFSTWFKDAVEDGTFEANALILSTVDQNAKPSSRVVLLKQVVEEGFIFFTNYDSRKSQNIQSNNQASILFFWEKFERQIRIEGVIEKIPEEMSLDYFKNRPLASQIGAVVSNQSEIISSRKVLEDKFKELSKLKSIDKPNNWGGYILKPNYFEFWQGRANRLHDRIIYLQENNSWNIKRLAP